jgi:hypothetical protein
MGSTLSARHFQRIWFYMYEARIHIIWRFQHVLFCIERVTLLNGRAVILSRDVEHCAVSSVNGIISIQFSKFRTEIGSAYCRLNFEHNTMYVGEGGDQFRYWIQGIGWKRNWPESNEIPWIAESNEIGTDSGGGTSSAMFNIAE